MLEREQTSGPGHAQSRLFQSKKSPPLMSWKSGKKNAMRPKEGGLEYPAGRKNLEWRGEKREGAKGKKLSISTKKIVL